MIFKTSTCENDASKIPCATSIDALSQVETDYGTALSDTSCFTKEVISPVKLCAGRSVLDVFGVCFDDGSSLLEDYHAERNDTDQKWEPWRATKDGGVFRGQRQFQCTTLVKAMMGKPYGYVEYERYALLNVNGILTLALQFSSQVPGVLFGEAFRVEVLMTFTQTGSGADCEVTMQVFGYVQFLKSVWVKSRILSTTMNTELPEGYKKLSTMIVARMSCESNEAVNKPGLPALKPLMVQEASPADPCIVHHQTDLERDFMAYGSTALSAFVVMVCLKSLWQTISMAEVTASQYCASEGRTGSGRIDSTCALMVTEWNGVFLAAKPSLIAIYFLLITVFCGATWKFAAMAERHGPGPALRKMIRHLHYGYYCFSPMPVT